LSPEHRTPRQQVQIWISESASAIEDRASVEASPNVEGRELRRSSLRTPRVRHNRSAGHGEASNMSYLPGLDGLRALAVIAVLLYHAGLAWIPGGFLGVEVFFVISGYLITALLLAEWRRRGSIDLKAFWMRRARRLLPALFVLLAATLAFAVLFLPGEVARLRNEAFAAFGYVTNWYLIFNQEPYFEAAGRPSMFRHLWSLAVEEQFYLIWPALIAAGMTFFRRRAVLAYVLGGALLSAVLMAFLYHPEADPSRLYYGTDTRASGLLVGAALAFVWVPEMLKRGPMDMPEDRRHGLRKDRRRGSLRHRWGWMIPRLLDVAGLLSLGALVAFFLRINEFQAFLYRGGLALVGLTTAFAILVVVHPRARLATKVLEWRPLRWIGLRSYSIYLWHWPVFMVTRPQLDVPLDGAPLLALRLAATVLLADLSYRFVEVPIRRGALERAWTSLRESEGKRRRQLSIRWAGGLTVGLVFSVVLGLAVVTAQPSDQPDYLSSKELHKGGELAQSPTGEESKAPVEAEGDKGPPPPQPQEDSATAAASNSAAGSPADGSGATQNPSVSAIGDSVMLGASAPLERRIDKIGTVQTLDAELGFQVSDVVGILRQRQAAGQLGEVVVVHVGNNGPLRTGQFDEIMRTLSGARKVVFVNVKVPRRWEAPNNEVLAEGVERYPNAVLADWYGFSSERPQLFWDDGMHLRPEGGRAYTGLILRTIRAGS
jgi:peptidoglycan/LPS O-acetylase OafA/YrhL